MAITPDEIAKRPFSPSVDGYHQGEVRSFLERIAAQLRALKAVQPEGQEHLVDLAMTLESHEPRIQQIEQRFGAMLSELEETTQRLASSQQKAIEELSKTQQLAASQLEATERLLNSQRAATHEAAQQIATPRAAAHQAAGEQTAADQTAQQAAAHLAAQRVAAQAAAAENAAAAERAAAEAAAQQAAAAQRAAAERAALQHAADERAHAIALSPHEVSLTFVDLPKPISGLETPVAAASQNDLGALFPIDLTTQPLFSDSANELLDGVLNDVMGTLNDKGSTEI